MTLLVGEKPALRSMSHEPPLTAAQLQEKIRSGNFRIESAPQEETERYDEEIGTLLRLIGAYMTGGDESEAIE